jgi:hypothetical protein
VNDTTQEIVALVHAHHAGMTPDMRMRIASDLFETARAIVESSLPAGLTERERRLTVARRFYGNELPEAALLQFANYL